MKKMNLFFGPIVIASMIFGISGAHAGGSSAPPPTKANLITGDEPSSDVHGLIDRASTVLVNQCQNPSRDWTMRHPDICRVLAAEGRVTAHMVEGYLLGKTATAAFLSGNPLLAAAIIASAVGDTLVVSPTYKYVNTTVLNGMKYVAADSWVNEPHTDPGKAHDDLRKTQMEQMMADELNGSSRTSAAAK